MDNVTAKRQRRCRRCGEYKEMKDYYAGERNGKPYYPPTCRECYDLTRSRIMTNKAIERLTIRLRRLETEDTELWIDELQWESITI